MFLNSLLSILIIIQFLGCNSGKKGPSSSEILALIDGKPITVEDFKKEIANHPGEYTSREQKEELLEKRVNFELLYAAAEKDGYDKDEEILSRFRRMIINKYKENILEPRVDKIEANEAEIAGGFCNPPKGAGCRHTYFHSCKCLR
jgi:hypothetical protein